MGKKEEKTNVMRLLDSKKLAYVSHAYDPDLTDAVQVARSLGQVPEQVFKTLVTVGASGGHFVFMVPAGSELDLKKAAKAAGEKSVQMILQRELLPLTGYIHGGCSPIGMKKPFPTFLDESALLFETIFFSGGRVGHQVQMKPEDLQKMMKITPADLTK
ncbi:MAG: Cys-tRNA(Pro) deacylase [Ruminococcaceae bacterium]|nr:Cys-tRNA(Pro) deacylase [Oscillospiraceae bacterium]